MAFEAFRAQDKARPRRGRRLTYTLSLALHGALIVVGVAYSFWHVEELTPPMVKVTFLSASPPPPPPPPPPPAAGGGPKKKLPTPKVKPIIVPPKPPEIVQPRETPPVKPPTEPKHDEDDDDDEPAGVKGGSKGGIPGGTISGTPGGAPGGTAAAPVAAKFLPPNMGALQKIGGEDPAFPPSLRRAGTMYAVIAKICVSRTGTVDTVTIMKKADPLLDANVVSAVKAWRFRPLMANNMAVPFCYPATFQFKGQ